MIQLSLTESAKVLPYIITSRKAVKLYLKVSVYTPSYPFNQMAMRLQKCLELWSTAEDGVRISAFLAIRKLASSNDDAILDTVLKVGLRLCLLALIYQTHVNIEYISRTRTIIKIYQCAQATIRKSDEKFCFRTVLPRSCNSIPTCIWVHTTARNTSSQQPEDKDKGTFFEFLTVDALNLIAGSI